MTYSPRTSADDRAWIASRFQFSTAPASLAVLRVLSDLEDAEREIGSLACSAAPTSADSSETSHSATPNTTRGASR